MPCALPRSRSSPAVTACSCRSSSTGFARGLRNGQGRESALDFEDLQLRARDLLRDDPEVRGPESVSGSAR